MCKLNNMQEVDDIKKKVIIMIKIGLKMKGLTQREFSSIMGITERHFSLVLNRKKPCTLDTLYKYYFTIKNYTT